MDKKEQKKLIRFLKELGCYTAFKHNINKVFENGGTRCLGRYPEIVVRTPDEYFDNVTGASVIVGGFDWAETDEGYAYWSVINYTWHMRMCEKRNDYSPIKDEANSLYETYISLNNN